MEYLITLGRHRRQWAFHASNCSPVHPELCLRSKSVRMSTTSLKFGGLMYSTTKHITLQNCHANFCAFHRTWNFHDLDQVWGMLTHIRKCAEITLRPKFGGVMQCTMKRITIWNGHAQPMFAFLIAAGRGAVVRWRSCFYWYMYNNYKWPARCVIAVSLAPDTINNIAWQLIDIALYNYHIFTKCFTRVWMFLVWLFL